jgi:peptidyl-prolyl cis-trans isomerase A (cyclophilin A)
MNPSLVTAALCAALLPAAAAAAQTPAAPHKTAPKTSAAGHATTGHTTSSHAAAGKASLLNPATLNATAPAEFKVRFTTTTGDVVLQVHRDWAPLGADRFYNLVKNGFYNNAAFFRVVPRFVVQFGLSPNPAYSKVWQEAKFADDPVTHSNKRGTLVFATAGPNTRTTQLFVNTVDNARLDGMGFAPFGEVVEGMENVDKIFPGYGQRPDQEQIVAQGDAYIKSTFPEMDKIKLAKLEPTTSPAAHIPTKPATKAPAKRAAAKPAPAAH